MPFVRVSCAALVPVLACTLMGSPWTSVASAASGPLPAPSLQAFAPPPDTGGPDLLAKLLERRALLPGATAATLSSVAGPSQLACGALHLGLDGFGGFGGSSGGTDATFLAHGVELGTVFESMAHLSGAGWLDGQELSLPTAFANATEVDGVVTADYALGPWSIHVTTFLEPCDAPERAELVQSWRVVNVSSASEPLLLTHYLDADLLFEGSHGDDFGALGPTSAFVFDVASAHDVPTAYVAVTTEAPAAARVAREIGEYADQRRRVTRGQVVDGRLVRADGSSADDDEDGVTDLGFDATLAVAHDFGAVAPGGSAEVTVRIRWGVGEVEDVLAESLVVDAGPDVRVECEGAAGTLVPVAATVSDAARVAAWTWTVDGEPADLRDAAGGLLLPAGAHVVRVEAVDDAGVAATDELIVDVVDATAPRVDLGGPVALWPPDHRLVEVALPASAFDACSTHVTLRPVSVRVEEPVAARGVSAPALRLAGVAADEPDAVVTDDGRLLLRRERSGRSAGRTYVVACEAVDESGNVTPFTFEAVVSHDRGRR